MSMQWPMTMHMACVRAELHLIKDQSRGTRLISSHHVQVFSDTDVGPCHAGLGERLAINFHLCVPKRIFLAQRTVNPDVDFSSDQVPWDQPGPRTWLK